MNRKDIIELAMAGVAIILSVLALVISTWSNHIAGESRDVAREALAVSQKGNDIAQGVVRVYPVIEVDSDVKGALVLQTVDQVAKSEALFFIRNRGKLPIRGLHLFLVGLSGLTYAINDPNDQYRAIDRIRIPVLFEEQLAAGGNALVDLRHPVVQYLHGLKLAYKDPKKVYRMVINVVVLPQALGQELPIETPGQEDKDRRILTVEYIPDVVWSKDVESILKEQKLIYHIFNYKD
jgi:hypothetical protein